MKKQLTPEEFEKTYLEKRKTSAKEASDYLTEVLSDPSIRNIQTKQYAKYVKAMWLFFALKYEEAEKMIASYLYSFRKYRFLPFYADSFNLMGMISCQRERHYVGIFYYNQALKLCDEMKLAKKLSMIYSNLSIAYSGIKDYSKALECLEKSFAYLSDFSDYQLRNNFLINKVNYLICLQRYSEADNLLNQFREENKDRQLVPSTYASIALLQVGLDAGLDKQEDFEKHLAEFRAKYSSMDIDVYSFDNYRDLARVLLEHGMYDEMNVCLRKIEEIDKEVPQIGAEIALAQLRSKYFQKVGDFSKADEQYALLSSLQEKQMKEISTELEQMISLHFDFVKLNSEFEKAKRSNFKLKTETLTDFITGLPNKSAFNKAAKRMDAEAKEGRLLAYGFIDFDSFKSINDTYGHLVGDKVLAASGKLLRTFISSDMKIFRFGGDEFVFIYTPKKEEDVLMALKMIEIKFKGSAITAPGGSTIPLSASIGYVILSHSLLTCEQGIAEADKCLYEAKKQGKGKIVGTTL